MPAPTPQENTHGRGAAPYRAPRRFSARKQEGKGAPTRAPLRRSPREERPRSEFDQKIVAIRRVTRVVSGGRRFSFSVALVMGNRKGSVGVGIGKASDTALAIEKAQRSARKRLVKVPLTKSMSLPHDVTAKYAASVIVIAPAPGRGLVAGSAARTVLELAGVRDVTAKILSRSRNKINNAGAALKALSLVREKK